MDRKEILETAIALTCGDRNTSYGDPSINLACAMELKEVFDRYSFGKGGTAHREAIHMALTKISRIATGAFKEDNYIDAAAYIAIAGQVHLQQASPELACIEEVPAPLPPEHTCTQCLYHDGLDFCGHQRKRISSEAAICLSFVQDK